MREGLRHQSCREGGTYPLLSLSLLSPYSLSIPSHQILDTFRVNELSPRLTVVEVAEVADQDEDG